MKERKDKLFWIITFVLCLALFLKRQTGEIVHVFFCVILNSMIGVHIYRHFGKIKYKNKSVRWVDWGLMVALATVFVTGILLHPLQGILLIKILHKLSSVFLITGMVVHVVQHKEKRA